MSLSRRTGCRVQVLDTRSVLSNNKKILVAEWTVDTEFLWRGKDVVVRLLVRVQGGLVLMLVSSSA